jgi:hypothetical protein
MTKILPIIPIACPLCAYRVFYYLGGISFLCQGCCGLFEFE